MPHRLILKVTKFQLPPSKRLGTMVKNILGGHHAPPPQCQIGLSQQNVWLKASAFWTDLATVLREKRNWLKIFL